MIKKFVAILALLAVFAMPFGCANKTAFVSTTDKIGRALAVVNAVYFVVEAQLEKALDQDLPDAANLQAYLTTLKSLRDVLASYMSDQEDGDKAQAAASVALQILEQTGEVPL